MPFIRISLAGTPPTDAQVKQLQLQTTGLMADILGKRPEVTVVAVESIPPSRWSIGGSPLGQEQTLAQIEAFITAGSNSQEEKADFITAAYETMATVLGAKVSPLYVVIHEITDSAWGYDGMTQAARRQAAQAL